VTYGGPCLNRPESYVLPANIQFRECGWIKSQNGEPRCTSRIRIKTSSPAWKDADPDIPIMKEAKAEYAKLQ
jgi:hypothetical protein